MALRFLNGTRFPAWQERSCWWAEQGLPFLPIVAEGSGGGWGPTAQKVFAVLGRALAARSGDLAAIETDRLGQVMSFTLQRENARAVLRRRAVDCARPACLPAP
ncbi:unnamed protein product [Effrenium voratum]|uniref:Uncharacterized protein n=1 Tax=Effrenium voratum TaxID=2562239 RepID=A0AA36J9A7_9DINO|nr:unnamed protein product [Effrenium voratum]